MVSEEQQPGMTQDGEHVVWITNTAAWRIGMLKYRDRPELECWYCHENKPIWLKIRMTEGDQPLCKDCAGAFCAAQWPVSTPDGFCRQSPINAAKIMNISEKSTGAAFWRNQNG